MSTVEADELRKGVQRLLLLTDIAANLGLLFTLTVADNDKKVFLGCFLVVLSIVKSLILC